MDIVNLRIALLAALITGLVGCGGGGGDSANSDITYSGSTARATLSADSARDSASDALGGMEGAALTRSTTETKETVHAIVKRLLLQKNQQARGARAVVDTGTCGGTITDTVHTETQTNYSATWSFNSFCEAYGAQTVTITGTIDVSATAESGRVTSMSMSYHNITITEQPGNFQMTMAGTVSFSFAGATETSTMTLVANNSTGESVMFQNYRVSVTNGFYSISGRFYHSAHGYVEFSTPAALYIGANGYPSSGQLLIEGANGRALITANTSTSYTLQLDIDGQAGYESSQAYNW